MRLILVRHGETNWNKTGKVQGGSSDIELNKTGLEQAKKTADRLKDEKIDFIISSPMKRAIQTAKEIAKLHNKELIINNQFLERDFGKLEGTEYEFLSNNMFKIFIEDSFEENKIERLEDFTKRIENVYREIFQKYFGKTVIIVSHSSTSKMLLSIILSKEFSDIRKIKKNNASISIIQFDENSNISDYIIGDDRHLIN